MITYIPRLYKNNIYIYIYRERERERKLLNICFDIPCWILYAIIDLEVEV